MTTETCDLNQGPYLGQTPTGASPLHAGIVEPQGIEEDMTGYGTERNRDGALYVCRKESMPSGSRPGSRGRGKAPKGYSFLSEAMERALLVECLPRVHDTLGSVPSAA